MSRLVRSLSVALFGAALFAFIPGKHVLAANPGWNEIDGEWYYYEQDGKTLHKGWLYSGKQWYYFDSEGKMAHDRIIIDEDYKGAYSFDSEGHMLKNKWVNWHIACVGDDGKTYYIYQYFGSDGLSYSGWKKISSKWYYFEGGHPAGNVPFGVREIDGKNYVFNTSGVLAGAGWVKSPFMDDNGNLHYYYANSSGIASVGWKQIGSKWYYFDKTGETGDIGYRFTGKHVIDGKTYIFGDDGAMMTGWYTDPSTGNKCYIKKDGSFAVSEWITVSGKKYYFDSKSFRVTGKVTIDGNLYWFADNGAMKTGWQQEDDKWYYLGNNGIVVKSDWVKIGTKKYYFGSKGVMVTGKVKIDGSYYMFADSGAMMTGWHKDANGNWNYLQSDGVMAISKWITDGGKKYYFNSSGVMYTGKKQVGGKYYIFADSGALYVNKWVQVASGDWYYSTGDGTLIVSDWLNQSGKWYHFGSTGIMAHNQKIKIDGVVYKFDANGVCTNHP